MLFLVVKSINSINWNSIGQGLDYEILMRLELSRNIHKK